MPTVPPFENTTQPPFNDIIRDSDPTAFVNLTDAGRGQRAMFDRRVNDAPSVNAYLFNASYYDGLAVEIQVHPEYGNVDAARNDAEEYGKSLGRLPTGARAGVKSMAIIPGNKDWGGLDGVVTIHAGRPYGDMRGTTLMHEVVHASLDPHYAWSAEWKAAQQADDAFICNYARDFPEREDVAESYVAYVALRYRSARIPHADADKIVRTIPNRIAFFDARPLAMQPSTAATA